MSMNGDNGQTQRSEINVTPLIDVLLVLLIIFMVIQPSVPLGLNASVPQLPKPTNPAEHDSPAVVVQILGHGTSSATYKINNTSFNRAEIKPELASIFATRSEKTMFIKGDAGLEFASVAEVINSGRQAGADTIAILTPHTVSSVE